MEEALDKIIVKEELVDIEIDRWIYARPAEISPDEPIVKAVIAAANKEGRNCEPTGFNAGSDARFLIADADIPTVLFGPGSIEEDAHTVNESIRTEDLIATARIYRQALEWYLA